MQKSKRGGSRAGAGRKPVEYLEEYAQTAQNVALLGGEDCHIAAMLEVSEQTIQRWKKQHPAFAEAIKAGRLGADLKVIRALFKSCCGHYVTETETRKVMEADGTLRVVEVIEHEKYIPPSTEACAFWLTNRQAERWQYPSRTNTTTATEPYQHHHGYRAVPTPPRLQSRPKKPPCINRETP